MSIETSEILSVLGLAKSSLGSPDSILPILPCYCFDGDIAYAYNDVTAIIVPLDTELECAVDGNTLNGVLQAKSGPFEMKAGKDGNVILQFKGKGSGSTITLPALPKVDFVFRFPEEKPALTLPLTQELVHAIDLCLISAAADNLVPEFAGVTIQASSAKGKLTLYATDNVSAGRVVLEHKQKGAYAAVIPEQAARQLVKLAAACTVKEATLALAESSMECGFEGVTLISRLLPAKPEKFEAVFAQHAEGIAYTDIPKGLKEEIGLAEVLLAKEQVKQCFLAFDGKHCSINASSALGVVAAKLPAPGLTGTVNISPGLFARIAAAGVGELAVMDRRALILRGGSFTHIISSAHVPNDDDIPQ